MDTKNVFLEVKDYSVSGERFQLLYNNELDMLETFPQPEIDTLANYYKSEDYISHTDSKRNLFEKVYHWVRNYSLQQKLKLINKYSSQPNSLLDIGCGTGDFLATAQKAGWQIQGIEPDAGARVIANKKTSNSVKDVEALEDFANASFDVITLWHVLEHLPNLDEQIQILDKLLKPEGTLILAVPNFKSHDAKHYKEFWAAYDVPRHFWHFSQDAISKLFSKVGMHVVQTKPMIFDSYYVSLLSEKYKTGKMKMLSAFFIGFISNRKAKRSGEYSSLIYILKKDENLK